MSHGPRVRLSEAWTLANRLARELAPHLRRVEIVGSVRRERPTVGDIELVAEPATCPTDLFGALGPALEPIRATLERIGTWEKGGDRYMKVRDVLDTGLPLDLFLVHPPAEWGSIVAIRTGPAALGRECITRMKREGYHHAAGHVVNVETGAKVATPEEEDFFRLAGVACMPPNMRDVQAQRLEMESRGRRTWT